MAADELGIPDEELESRLARLQLLLPEIAQKLPSMVSLGVGRDPWPPPCRRPGQRLATATAAILPVGCC